MRTVDPDIFIESMDAIDAMYEHLSGLGLIELDFFLQNNPMLLSGEEIVSVLILTLSLKNLLPSRVRFIEAVRPILNREGDGDSADAILKGLE